MLPTHRKIIHVITTFIVVGCAWWLSARNEAPRVAAALSQPVKAIPGPAKLTEQPKPKHLAKWVPLSAPKEVTEGRLLEQKRTVLDAEGQFQEVSVYETNFKYPLLRVEKQMQREATGQETVLAQRVMVADHLLVRSRAGLSKGQMLGPLSPWVSSVRRSIVGKERYLLKLSDDSVAGYDAALRALKKLPDLLLYAEPDYIVHHCAAPVIPNDSAFAGQWHLHNTGQSGGTADADVDAPEAWSVTTGSAGITVAVIDTGIDLTHPDLVANLWVNPGESGSGNETDGIDNDANGYIDDVRGWNFVTHTNSPHDDNGHGSHTGGLVGAVGGNLIGVSGVCPNIRLMPLKFLSASGSGSNSDAIEAIDYATAKGMLLTSNSWGGSGFSQAMLEAIQDAESAGIGFIAAAGNSGLSNDLYADYPASFAVPNLISVAATDDDDTLTWFSNFGQNTVHLGAPGLQVYSTTMNGGYAYNSGTSMAAPQVSGAAALLKAANAALSFSQIKAMLISQVDAKPSLLTKTQSGGRLNAAGALIPATMPLLRLGTLTVNGDGIASPGETVQVIISTANIGAFEAANVQGVLALKNITPDITLLSSSAGYGSVSAGSSATHLATPFEIAIAPTFTPTDLPLTLTLTDDQSRVWVLNVTLKIRTVTTISGTVTKVTGSLPFAGATVTLTGPETQTLSTDVSGFYTATVTNGSYNIQAAAAGYAPSAIITRSVPPAASNVNFALGYSAKAITPSSLSVTLAEGVSSTQSITIENTGDQALTYTIQEVPAAESVAAQLQPMRPLSPPSAPTPTFLTDLPAHSLLGPISRTRDASDYTATTLPFRDGFEDGLWGRWFTSWGAGTREVVSNTAGTGSKSFHFHFDGPDDHFTGIHQIFPSGTQPGYVSFWTRPGAEDSATSYMVLLDLYYVFDASGLRAEIADFIWFFANTNGRFYLNDNSGGNQSIQYTEGDWYHIEFRNMSWVTKTFDYWVNGQLIQSQVPFRNPNLVSGMAYALTYNYFGDSDMGLDDVKFQSDELPWLSLASKQGSIPPGGSATITATFSAANVPAGSYTGGLRVSTNDPNAAITTLPVQLTVTAVPNAVPLSSGQTHTLGYSLNQTITLTGSDADNDPLRFQIISLPSRGSLYQTSNGSSLGSLITNTPTVISDAQHRVIFQPDAETNGSPYASFSYHVSDPKLNSAPATIMLNVLDWPLLSLSPPGSTSASPVDVTFNCTDPAAQIRFTLDGSPPATGSPLIVSSSSLRLDHSLTVKAFASKGTHSSPIQTYLFTIIDADSNGLPDWWEAQYPALISGTGISLIEDTDHDGINNRDEFILGTNPQLSDSFQPHLQITSTPAISWPSQSGRVYQIQVTSDLDLWTPLGPARLGTGSIMNYQSLTPVLPPQFYRLEVTLP